jgi:hypothetical protein
MLSEKPRRRFDLCFSQLITDHWSLITQRRLRRAYATISELVAPHFQQINHFESGPTY